VRDDGRVRGTRQARAGGAPGAEERLRPAPGGPDLGRVLAVVALLAVAVLGSALAGPWTPQLVDDGRGPVTMPLDPPTPETPAVPTAEPSPDTARAEPDLVAPPWLRPALVTATLLAVALLVLHLARRFRQEGADTTPESGPGPLDPGAGGARDRAPDLRALRDGVAAAAEQLRSAARPVDAVIAAWVRLEEAAAASGLPREPASTPTEFTLAVLDRTHADRSSTRVLLDLYLRARFGDEHLGADDVAVARRAVDDLSTAFARAAGEQDGDDTGSAGP
jgi:hypothetical protein